MKIELIVGKDIILTAKLYSTETARTIYENLPLEGQGSTWGEEIYFSTPVNAPLEDEARDVLEAGELGYWPNMQAFCIFYGPTPASKKDEIRAAGSVNVFGKLIEDYTPLKDIKGSVFVRVEKA